jgi:hypothetical protein
MSLSALRSWSAQGLDQRPEILAFVHRLAGQITLFVLASLLLWPHLAALEVVFTVASALVIARCTAWRGPVLFAITWGGALLSAGLGWTDLSTRIDGVLVTEGPSGLSASQWAVGAVVGCGLMCVALLRHVVQHPKSWIARHPLACLLGGVSVAIAMASWEGAQGLPRLIVWALVMAWTPYVWFMPYAIAQARSANATSTLQSMGFLRSVWSPTYFPIGKQGPYLMKHQGKTSTEVAVSQVKGIKLLVWTACLMALNHALHGLLSPFFPELSVVLDAWVAGRPFAIGIEWGSLVLSTAMYCIDIVMWLNLFVAIARLAGFKLPRASWRPLESKTLLDYFNRFNFYFKELLVDYFFMPTFFKWFKSLPRLRMFAATFMAAGVGNALWHFTRDIHLIHDKGLYHAVMDFSSYLVYCLLLAIGIGVSQVRVTMGIKPSNQPWGRFQSFVLIWTFVTLLRVFSDLTLHHDMADRISFLLGLFGAWS